MTDEAKKEVTVRTAKPAAVRRAAGPFEDLEHLLERVTGRGWLRPFGWERPLWGGLMEAPEFKVPAVDVIDRDNAVVVRAEIPGVDKKDLEVSMTENTLTVKGSVSREEKEEKGDYYRCEIARGAFSRTVSLPGDVDGSKASATLKDGVLEISLPKSETAKRRNIKVD